MRFIAGFGLLVSGVSALATRRSPYAVKETHPVPGAWVKDGAAPKDHSIQLRFGLKQANPAAVEEHLAKSSDPKHELYGQHLTADEVHALTGPSDETLDRVRSWLMDNGITTMFHNPAKDFITVHITIEKAEDLLQTTYSRFKHDDGDVLLRAPEWSLPVDLHEHIDLVQPTTSFFRPKKNSYPAMVAEGSFSMDWWEAEGKHKYGPQAHVLAASSSSGQPDVSNVCSQNFTTLECLRVLYRTKDYKAVAANKNSIGVCNYLNETGYRKDIYQFLASFRSDDLRVANVSYEFETVIINNGRDDQGPYTADEIAKQTNIEGNLDAELVLGISYPTKYTAFNTGGMPPFTPDAASPTNTNEPYMEFLDYILSQRNIPNVITSSYGDDEQTVPYSYASRVCQGFAQLGARGTTVLFSSGDSGVGPAANECITNDGKKKFQFIPAFPTSCPYVTSVGGTQGFNPEVAVNRFASGGGFSNYFARPSYQQNAVSGYLSNLKGVNPSYFNATGRAYPDVAAQSDLDVIVWNSQIIRVGGTSASCPTFAAVLALVNDALIGKGKPTLGFINPWLYSTANVALTDVISGSSFGCGTNGFPAAVGWDPVTGWGTPDLPKLITQALKKQN